MYRSFNLLDVALQYLAAYCNYKSTDDLLVIGSSANSLRCIYGIASLLKEWVEELVEQYRSFSASVFTLGTEDKSDRFINGTVKDIKLKLHHLFPCNSKMRSSLITACLYPTPAEFSDDCLKDNQRGRFPSFQRAQEAKRAEEANRLEQARLAQESEDGLNEDILESLDDGDGARNDGDGLPAVNADADIEQDDYLNEDDDEDDFTS